MIGWGATAVALVFSYLAWTESRHPYNELGRYFDGIAVHLEQDVEMYVFLAILSAVVAIVLFRLTRRRQAS